MTLAELSAHKVLLVQQEIGRQVGGVHFVNGEEQVHKRYKKGSSIEEELNRLTSAPRSIRKTVEQESAAPVGTSRHPIFEA